MKNTDGRVDGNHSTIYTSADILAHPSVQLTRGGLILIGLLSGGDYHQAGLQRCGPGIAHGLAKCGFGDELLKAVHSLSCDELPNFLTTWREDLCVELRTNARGYLGSKRPSLAKAVPDSFPDIDVLLSYTNPIISATDASARRTHTPPRWEREPDLGKLAHICELHFEWGLKDIIIKRFRTIIWPGIVLRALRRSALERATGCRSASGEPLQDMFGTPSKLLARHFSSMGFGAQDTGGDGDGSLRELIVKIHSSRTHAYTDGILEYRLEVAPALLVRLASAGIQGLRTPADTTYDVLPSESEEESGGDPDVEDTVRRKKHGTAPPPRPDSHLRMWMPACMVRPELPELVEQYEVGLKAKRVKNPTGILQASPVTTKTNSPSSKRKVAKPPVSPVDLDAEEFDLYTSHSSEDEVGGGEGSAQQQVLDLTMTDNEVDAAPSEKLQLPLLSPSKVLQKLDFDPNVVANLCGAQLPPSVSSPSARTRAPLPSALRPFPMALEASNDGGDRNGYLSNTGATSNHYPLSTPFTVTTSRTQSKALTPPPSPRRRASRFDPFPLPPAKEARTGDPLEEGQILHVRGATAETSAISISSADSDDGDDGSLALAPLLVARSSALVLQRVPATDRDADDEVIDLT
jgi:hypothetical protein